MVETAKGCKECQFLTELNKCPQCGGKVSSEWRGFLVILDYSRSKIAKNMGLTMNGSFALKVR